MVRFQQKATHGGGAGGRWYTRGVEKEQKRQTTFGLRFLSEKPLCTDNATQNFYLCQEEKQNQHKKVKTASFHGSTDRTEITSALTHIPMLPSCSIICCATALKIMTDTHTHTHTLPIKFVLCYALRHTVPSNTDFMDQPHQRRCLTLRLLPKKRRKKKSHDTG